VACYESSVVASVDLFQAVSRTVQGLDVVYNGSAAPVGNGVVPDLVVIDVGYYLAVKDRVASLVIEADQELPVPACPVWRVRDLVAHLSGLCEDWVAHRLDGYASQAWTESQVARFAQCPLPEILRRWDTAAEAFASLPDDPTMGPPARWAFGDAVIHEADSRGAVGGGRVPDEAVALALKGAISRWRRQLADARTPTLVVRVPDQRDWWIGVPDDPEAVTVIAPAYEVFSCLGRSPDTGAGAGVGLGPRPVAISRGRTSVPLPLGHH
jgi:uncharacterized protein (TIGR03083 family)